MLKTGRLLLALAVILAIITACQREPPPTQPIIEKVLTDLENPRAVVVAPGELFVVEAGTGYDAVDPVQMTGKLTRFRDEDGDGDFSDDGAAEQWFSHLPTYNSLRVYGNGRDEVNGASSLLRHDDGRFFLTIDGGFEDRNLLEISPDGRIGRSLVGRNNMNSIAFDRTQEKIYAVESGFNRLIEVTLDGTIRDIVTFPLLASDQEAVPAGLAVDPRNGDVLVALFSGGAAGETAGEQLPFIPGDSKVVRVDPATGAIEDAITGLTTAVAVAVDAAGNIFVVEMAADYSDLLPTMFDLFDPDTAPHHGGYQRFSGRVTRYPADDGPSQLLADGLDTPTNVTIGPDGALYVSVGQGTPGRPIPGPDGPTTIVGQVLRISGFPIPIR